MCDLAVILQQTTFNAQHTSVNVPLPIGTYDAAYMKVIGSVVMPLIHAYKPDVIVIELGADGLRVIRLPL